MRIMGNVSVLILMTSETRENMPRRERDIRAISTVQFRPEADKQTAGTQTWAAIRVGKVYPSKFQTPSLLLATPSGYQ